MTLLEKDGLSQILRQNHLESLQPSVLVIVLVTVCVMLTLKSKVLEIIHEMNSVTLLEKDGLSRILR